MVKICQVLKLYIVLELLNLIFVYFMFQILGIQDNWSFTDKLTFRELVSNLQALVSLNYQCKFTNKCFRS